jgi:hypothetical protein
VKFPDDSLQSIIFPSDWWVKNTENKLCRGALIYAFVPHVDQIPYSFEPVGRKQADHHDKAIVKVSPLQVDQPLKQVNLPVAAMPLFDHEVWAAYRAKKRPCLVIREASQQVDKELTRGLLWLLITALMKDQSVLVTLKGLEKEFVIVNIRNFFGICCLYKEQTNQFYG